MPIPITNTMIVVNNPQNIQSHLSSIDIERIQTAIDNGGTHVSEEAIYRITQEKGRRYASIFVEGKIALKVEFIETFWVFRNQYGELKRFDNPFDAVSSQRRDYTDIWVVQIWE